MGPKRTEALANGLPSSVTRPETGAIWCDPLPQPAASRAKTKGIIRAREFMSLAPSATIRAGSVSDERYRHSASGSDKDGLRTDLERVRLDDLAAGDGRQCRQHGNHIHVAADGLHGAVAEGPVEPARMEATPGPLALVIARRRIVG